MTAVFGDRQQQWNDQQVLDHHVQREGDAGHRGQGEEQDRVADEATVRTRRSHREEGTGERVAPLYDVSAGIAEPQGKQGAGRVGQQVTDVENVGQAAFGKGLENQRR